MLMLRELAYALGMKGGAIGMTSPNLLAETIVVEEKAPVTQCQHHWLIEQAAGPTSLGRCQRCGAEREFYNDPEAARIDQPAVR